MNLSGGTPWVDLESTAVKRLTAIQAEYSSIQDMVY